jgi:hypothetical protein
MVFDIPGVEEIVFIVYFKNTTRVDKRRPLTSFVSQMNPFTTELLLSLRDYNTQRKTILTSSWDSV